MTHKRSVGDIYWIAVYIALQLAADIAAVKMTEIWGFVIPAGTFVFALTFTLRDLLHERIGIKATVAVVWAAAMANVILSAYVWFATLLPPAGFWQGQGAFATTLMAIPRITLASIVAELVSELVDTLVYELGIRNKWVRVKRVFLSNTISVILDSLVFVVLAFAGQMPAAVLFAMARSTAYFKLGVTILSLPLVAIKRRKEVL